MGALPTPNAPNLDVLRSNSDEAFTDIVEYVKRDIANRAFNNPENHGRNTAVLKGSNGSVRLAPLFDFAPMRLAVEGKGGAKDAPPNSIRMDNVGRNPR